MPRSRAKFAHKEDLARKRTRRKVDASGKRMIRRRDEEIGMRSEQMAFDFGGLRGTPHNAEVAYPGLKPIHNVLAIAHDQFDFDLWVQTGKSGQHARGEILRRRHPTPTVTRPASSDRKANSASRHSSDAFSILCAASRTSCPAGVGSSPRGVRSKSGKPISSSSCRICIVTAGGVTLLASAAAAKLPRRAALAANRRCLRVMLRIKRP